MLADHDNPASLACLFGVGWLLIFEGGTSILLVV